MSSVGFVHPESVRTICLRTVFPMYGLSADPNCYVMLHQPSCFEHLPLIIFIIRGLWPDGGRATSWWPNSLVRHQTLRWHEGIRATKWWPTSLVGHQTLKWHGSWRATSWWWRNSLVRHQNLRSRASSNNWQTIGNLFTSQIKAS